MALLCRNNIEEIFLISNICTIARHPREILPCLITQCIVTLGTCYAPYKRAILGRKATHRRMVETDLHRVKTFCSGTAIHIAKSIARSGILGYYYIIATLHGHLLTLDVAHINGKCRKVTRHEHKSSILGDDNSTTIDRTILALNAEPEAIACVEHKRRRGKIYRC